MTEKVIILVDGESLPVAAESTLASALFGAGRVALRQSVDGSPRGPLCGMGTCFECRVTIDGVRHRRACLEPIVAGMEVTTGG
jgi:D-hydroxyproline dehydrogenase subunit gamma